MRRPSKLSAKHRDTSTESFPKFTGCNGTIQITCDILKCYNQLVIINNMLKWISYQASWHTWTKFCYQRGQLTAWNYAALKNMKSKLHPGFLTYFATVSLFRNRLLSRATKILLYRVSQEERTKLREGVPYVKLYRYNPKHLYPKLNGYGDNGKWSLKLWQLLHTYWLPNSY